MKPELLVTTARRLVRDRRWKRRLMVVGGVGFAGIALAGAVGVWLTISAANYVSQAAQSPAVLAKVQGIQQQVGSISPALDSCLHTAMGLLSAQAWTAQAVPQNLRQLKLACLTGENPSPDDPRRTEAST